MRNQDIPIAILDTQALENSPSRSITLLENEIGDVRVEHMAVSSDTAMSDSAKEGERTVYLFIKGTGSIVAENQNYKIEPETIFLPNNIKDITISTGDNSGLHFLKVSCKLSAADFIELEKLPAKNTNSIYHARFSDCQSYTEEIKSPNTVSRTILSNEYIPRVAMGTVHTIGPDKVAPHEHPMLEQLFLGLSDNNCVVYADDSKVGFPQYSVVHIPLGSSHSVSA